VLLHCSSMVEECIVAAVVDIDWLVAEIDVVEVEGMALLAVVFVLVHTSNLDDLSNQDCRYWNMGCIAGFVEI